MNLNPNPYALLLPLALLFLIVGLFTFNTDVEINLYDEYFYFSFSYFAWTSTVILFVSWLLYLAGKKVLFSRALSWTHVLLTLFACLFLLAIPSIFENMKQQGAGVPRRFYDTEESNLHGLFTHLPKSVVMAGVLFMVGQLTYLLHFSIGLYTWHKRRNGR